MRRRRRRRKVYSKLEEEEGLFQEEGRGRRNIFIQGGSSGKFDHDNHLKNSLSLSASSQGRVSQGDMNPFDTLALSLLFHSHPEHHLPTPPGAAACAVAACACW